MQDVATIRAKFEAVRPYLDERRRRLWAAAEALALGRGGMTAVAAATGLQRATIRVGVRKLQSGPSTSTEHESVAEAAQRVRAPGDGRKPLTTEDPTLVRKPGGAGGAGHPWRPDVAVALDGLHPNSGSPTRLLFSDASTTTGTDPEARQLMDTRTGLEATA